MKTFNYERYKRELQYRENIMNNIDGARPKCIINNSLSKEDGYLIHRKLKHHIPTTNDFILNQGADNLLSDLFNHWHEKDKDYSLRPDKYWWHHILSRLDNHLLQKLTNDNTLYSYIATKNSISILRKLLDKFSPEEMQQFADDMQANAEGDSSRTPNQDIMDAIEKASTSVQNKIKKEISDAENLPGGLLSGDAPNDLNQLEALPKDVMSKLRSINKGQIGNFLKSTIDYAIEATTGKDRVTEESIFEADEIDDISNIENFAHIALFDDLMVTKKTKHVSFDIYIDDSGSMTSRVYGGEFNNTQFRTLAHLLAFRLMQLNILRKSYLFSSHGQIEEFDKKDLFKARFSGGTDIQQCIKKAQKEKRPAILITDGYDQIDPKKDYYKDMYILVLGTSLPSCFKEFAKNNQILFFYNSKFTNKLDYQEYNIKPIFK